MRTALRNLYRNKMRSAMTICGAAVGISVFVSLVSISDGFKTQIQDIIKSHSIDITVQASGAATPISSKISGAEYAALGNVPGVADVSSLVFGPIKTPWNPYFLVVGISSAEQLAARVGLQEGRIFAAGRKEVMLGEHLAKEFGYRAGSKIVIAGNEIFAVSGIYSTGSRLFDNGALLGIDDARRILKRDTSINMALLRIKEGTDPGRVVEEIHSRLPQLSAVRTGDFTGNMRVFQTVDTFAMAISLVSLFACCIIIMNTLLMAVSERTREIGILMAMGWSGAMIMRTILFEALLVCLFGGLLGNSIGLFVLWSLGHSDAVGLGWVPVSISSRIFLQSMGISVLLGIVSSLYPSFVASRLMPAEALRYE